MGDKPFYYEQDGEIIEVYEQSNLPQLLDAHIQNRFDQPARALEVRAYQEFLKEYKLGQTIAASFEIVYESQFTDLIEPVLREDEKTAAMIGYAAIAEEVSLHLPDDVEPWVLRNPPLDLEAAA